MSSVQIILLIAIVLIIVRVILRYRDGRIDRKMFVWWFLFWLVGAGIVVVPESSNRIADIVGVGRGADVIIYGALIILFFLIFKLFMKMVKIEKDIINIVRTLALKDNEKKPKQE